MLKYRKLMNIPKKPSFQNHDKTLIYDPTMMLLMGIWMSLTKNPINPMMANPIAVATAIFWYSFRSGFVQRFTRRNESLANWRTGSMYWLTWSILSSGKGKRSADKKFRAKDKTELSKSSDDENPSHTDFKQRIRFERDRHTLQNV